MRRWRIPRAAVVSLSAWCMAGCASVLAMDELPGPSGAVEDSSIAADTSTDAIEEMVGGSDSSMVDTGAQDDTLVTLVDTGRAPMDSGTDIDATTDTFVVADATVGDTTATDTHVNDTTTDTTTDDTMDSAAPAQDTMDSATFDTRDSATFDTMPPPDGGPPLPPSCSGGPTCGSESCCTSLSVPGGTLFKRSYDGVNYTDGQYTATVSSFRLDKYEITVGRFRKFVDALVGGWTPAAGSGKHTHLNGGNGLSTGIFDAGTSFEPGWDSAWTATHLPPSKTSWDEPGVCLSAYQTWTPSALANETKPINCVNWYQAYAFCIWDGGFLPSEAEWNYAAANGTEQTVYPWGSTVPGANTNLAIYGCYYNGTGTCGGVQNIAPVGTVPAGNGTNWGHADLAGNVYEWTFDLYSAAYPQPCNNCASIAGSNRVIRGGSFYGGATSLRAGYRNDYTPTNRVIDIGARCARTP